MIIFLRQFLYNKRIFTVLSILLIGIVACLMTSKIEIQAQESMKMYAKSYALTDGETNRVLVGKNETMPMANASTTKILTCIIALENNTLDELVIISENAASQPKVRLGMREGEQYPLKDLLFGLMLESYNDCAVAIAEHVAGSEEEFSDLLNQKAVELGCQDTYFLTPNGLDAENEKGFHHTTAVDLCKMMSYCVWDSPMKEEFLQITQTRIYSGSSNGKEYTFTNRNAFLDQMQGVLSGKTGYTAKAGYCYVAAFENDGERYCVSLLACGWPNHKTYKWSDTRTLFTYGVNNYDKKRIELAPIEKEIGIDGYVSPADFNFLNKKDTLKICGEKRSYELLLGESEKVENEIVLEQNIELPIVAGQVLGQCKLYVENMLFDEIELIAMESAVEWKWIKILWVILYQFLTFSS